MARLPLVRLPLKMVVRQLLPCAVSSLPPLRAPWRRWKRAWLLLPAPPSTAAEHRQKPQALQPHRGQPLNGPIPPCEVPPLPVLAAVPVLVHQSAQIWASMPLFLLLLSLACFLEAAPPPPLARQLHRVWALPEGQGQGH